MENHIEVIQSSRCSKQVGDIEAMDTWHSVTAYYLEIMHTFITRKGDIQRPWKDPCMVLLSHKLTSIVLLQHRCYHFSYLTSQGITLPAARLSTGRLFFPPGSKFAHIVRKTIRTTFSNLNDGFHAFNFSAIEGKFALQCSIFWRARWHSSSTTRLSRSWLPIYCIASAISKNGVLQFRSRSGFCLINFRGDWSTSHPSDRWRRSSIHFLDMLRICSLPLFPTLAGSGIVWNHSAGAMKRPPYFSLATSWIASVRCLIFYLIGLRDASKLMCRRLFAN